MAYIPLPLELKTKGKATVEVIGGKIGKSLGAFVQFSIFTFAPHITFDSIILQLMVVFVIIMVAWVVDLKKLNAEYLLLQK